MNTICFIVYFCLLYRLLLHDFQPSHTSMPFLSFCSFFQFAFIFFFILFNFSASETEVAPNQFIFFMLCIPIYFLHIYLAKIIFWGCVGGVIVFSNVIWSYFVIYLFLSVCIVYIFKAFITITISLSWLLLFGIWYAWLLVCS